jgi:hypothetical protein
MSDYRSGRRPTLAAFEGIKCMPRFNYAVVIDSLWGVHFVPQTVSSSIHNSKRSFMHAIVVGGLKLQSSLNQMQPPVAHNKHVFFFSFYALRIVALHYYYTFTKLPSVAGVLVQMQ